MIPGPLDSFASSSSRGPAIPRATEVEERVVPHHHRGRSDRRDSGVGGTFIGKAVYCCTLGSLRSPGSPGQFRQRREKSSFRCMAKTWVVAYAICGCNGHAVSRLAPRKGIWKKVSKSILPPKDARGRRNLKSVPSFGPFLFFFSMSCRF